MDTNLVTLRFLEVVEKLQKDGFVKSDSELAKKLGTYVHKINKIKAGIVSAGTDVITQLCNTFDFVNIKFIMLGKGEIYNSQNLNPTNYFEPWFKEHGIDSEIEKDILIKKIQEFSYQIMDSFKAFKSQCKDLQEREVQKFVDNLRTLK